MKLKIKKYRKWKRIDRWLQTAIIAMSIIIVGSWVYSQTITVLTLGRLQLGNNTTVTGGQVLLPNGASGAPSLAPTSWPTEGIYFTDGHVNLSISGGQVLDISSTGLYIYIDGEITLGTSADIRLVRDAANTLALKNANFDQTQRWYGANGAYFQVATQSELLTILAAATTDTTMSIPANAVVRGVAVYVQTAIPAPTANFTVTGATSGTVFNTAAVGAGLGSKDVGTQNTPYKNGAAQLIRITPDAIPGAATGKVRIVLVYEIPSPPTS